MSSRASGARQRRHRWGLLAVMLMMLGSAGLALGCGGSKKKTAEPELAPADDDDVVEEPAPKQSLMPAEKLDEIESFMRRKSRHISRCIGEAGNEVGRNAVVKLTVSMTISKAGKPQNVKLTEIEPKSEKLEECVLRRVRDWTITTLPKPLDYSKRFVFDSL